MTQVAVLHDGTAHPGGAVDVVTQIATSFDADLYVGYSGVDRDWWVERVPNEVTILTNRESGSTLTDARVSLAFLRLSLQEYDLVFSSGPAAKFYQPYDDQRVFHYLHHPPLASLWFDGGLLDYIVTTVDRIETWAIETVVANSELTADRMAAHYSRRPDAVVNPPVDVGAFSTDRERNPNEVVMVGRLEERKRPALAVEAFGQLNAGEDPPQLRLIGDGPLRDTLEKRAPVNVTFDGYLPREDLISAVERASAGLFVARREDFGVTPVEYMAAGTPIVGVDELNTSSQVDDGETGLLVDPDPHDVANGVKRALDRDWNRGRLRTAAEEYGPTVFEESIRAVVDETR